MPVIHSMENNFVEWTILCSNKLPSYLFSLNNFRILLFSIFIAIIIIMIINSCVSMLLTIIIFLFLDRYLDCVQSGPTFIVYWKFSSTLECNKLCRNYVWKCVCSAHNKKHSYIVSNGMKITYYSIEWKKNKRKNNIVMFLFCFRKYTIFKM